MDMRAMRLLLPAAGSTDHRMQESHSRHPTPDIPLQTPVWSERQRLLLESLPLGPNPKRLFKKTDKQKNGTGRAAPSGRLRASWGPSWWWWPWRLVGAHQAPGGGGGGGAPSLDFLDFGNHIHIHATATADSADSRGPSEPAGKGQGPACCLLHLVLIYYLVFSN
jgi:hypothetical protein